MRILFCLLAMGGFVAALSGCGTPEAEFAWSEDTQNLLPEARQNVKTYVKERFGTPGEMVAWQRLPIAFGGVPGRVTEVERREFDGKEFVTSLKVDFRAQAMIAKYDANLDGRLSLSEFPTELQKQITDEIFQQADENGDNFLSPAEVVRLRVRSDLFDRNSVSQIEMMIDERLEEAQDGEENIDRDAERKRIADEIKQELIGKELLFVNGTFGGMTEKPEITDIDLESGKVEIWPPLSDTPRGADQPVDLAFDRVIVDFGRTMRSGRHLYMRHCMHCHGVTGDGNGPTAKYLNPLPRDYRKGIFKFVSTPTDIKHPNREDIVQVLRRGIPGTYMPSFAMLKDKEVTDITEYVRWLAMRGEYESSLSNIILSDYSNEAVADEVRRKVLNYELALKDFEAALEEGKAEESDRPEKVTEASVRKEIREDLKEDLQDLPEDSDDEADRLAEFWRSAERHANIIYPKVAKPPSTKESIARGRQLYLGKCAVCHGVMAEGNGENTRGYQKNPVTDEEYSEPGLFDDWGQPIEPRNLNTGIYRGGRRPLDIYRRIHQGIPGTPMQAFNSAFSDEQIWDLVDYVMSIPISGPVPEGADRIAQASEPDQKPDEPAPAQAEKKETAGVATETTTASSGD